MTSQNLRGLARNGLIAAAYAALSLALTPFTFGQVQCRVSEALTLLPVLCPSSVWGVTLGCVVTNLVGASAGTNFLGIADVFLGSAATLVAGLMTAKERCDMAISMDADLQDDIDAVDAMVEQYYGGCDIVYGVRSSRQKDTFFKRFTAEAFYRLMNFMGAETVFNHADYRLMSTASCHAGPWTAWPGSRRSTCSSGASCP